MEASELADRVFDVVGPAIGARGAAAPARDEQQWSARKVEFGRVLLQEIYWRDKSTPSLETAVNDYSAGVKNHDAASVLRQQIKKMLESDAALADEVGRMLRARPDGDSAESGAETGTGAEAETIELFKR
ncbi:hypothetical protein GCM10009839_18330 [Catenulispora yoronensis]|uniref:Uncharacterized protein n=1 Tax=Catenulispora yoronensis TaxID=450799 RepID=A0ABN2TU74_9ACTN